MRRLVRRSIVVLSVSGLLAGGVVWWRSRGPAPPRIPDGVIVDPAIAAYANRTALKVGWLPTNTSLRLKLGMIYDANGLTELAEQVYLQTVQLDPDEELGWYHLARVRADLGELERAIEAIDRSIAIDAEYAPAYWRRGTWLLALSRVKEAAGSFERALEIDRQDASAAIGLAQARIQQNRPDEAVRILAAVVAKDPDHGFARRMLGMAHRAAGDPQRGAVEYSLAVGAHPIWPDPRELTVLAHQRGFGAVFEQARARIELGRADLAIPLLEQLMEQRPDYPPILNNLAGAYLQNDQLDAADELLTSALRRQPDEPTLTLSLAVVRHRQGRLDEAIRLTRLAVALQPSSGPAQYQLGVLLLQDGKPADAVAALSDALDLGADRLKTALELGRAQLAANLTRQAERTFKRVADDFPSSSAAFTGLAESLIELGRFAEAREAIDRAAGLAPVDARLPLVAQRLRAAEEDR